MFERFSDEARRVVVWAQQESQDLGHESIGTEHLLLGLFHDDTVGSLLGKAGIEAAAVRDTLEAPGRLKRKGADHGHIPFTVRAHAVLGEASRTAFLLGGHIVGPVHLLLAILDRPDSAGRRLLAGSGRPTATLTNDAEVIARHAARSERSGSGNQGWRQRGAGKLTSPAEVNQLGSDITALIGDLVENQTRLLAAVQRYGRHLDACHPQSVDGCTCGFDRVLHDEQQD